MTEPCGEMQLLVQADVDGELTAAEAARVAAHVESCPACAALQAELLALSEGLRAAPYHRAPELLRARIAAASRSAPPARRLTWRRTAPFSGFALAACLALALVLPRREGLPGELVADHIRALQPGHLTDVVSTDQHTVKPWFDGRLDYSPPVKNLAAERFPLLGGRLDYLAGREVAVLAYGRDKHVIDLYVWPDRGAEQLGDGAVNGYNIRSWRQDGMVFHAVSDLNGGELGDFVRLWRRP